MAVKSKKFQAPRGTRDFYPADLAVRRHIENVWREVSINHGFEEIDGPTFEHLEMYTHKSGPGIVSELFSFKRSGGETDYALRPEFTPTLARMVAARASELPKPIKWFSIGPMFRAERPQRGRLREHIQWNVDIIGVPKDGAYKAELDVEILSVLVDALESLGLNQKNMRLKFGTRKAIEQRLEKAGVNTKNLESIYDLLDSRLKIPQEEYERRAKKLGLPNEVITWFDPKIREVIPLNEDVSTLPLPPDVKEFIEHKRQTPGDLFYELAKSDITEWCEFDSSVIRGLAYYTDLVFEVYDASSAERAIAGGGRYDNLIESFGGPAMPACGFGMGDVVLSLVLQDKGLLKPAEEYLPRPDVFVVSSGDEQAGEELPKTVSNLRSHGLHVRHSYRSTRNVGKLLGEAGKSRARVALILDKKLPEQVAIKDLETGDQNYFKTDETLATIRLIISQQTQASQ